MKGLVTWSILIVVLVALFVALGGLRIPLAIITLAVVAGITAVVVAVFLAKR